MNFFYKSEILNLIYCSLMLHLIINVIEIFIENSMILFEMI